MNYFLSIGSLFGLLAVMIGAFGAHGLEDKLTAHALARYQTGVEYQFYHVGALLIVGLLLSQTQSNILNLSGIFFTLGIILFSGSLYTYALTGSKFFGMITPIGGLCFLVGWGLLLAFSLKRVG
jgi:uncharacterized membrane protein YgdD (TMEM256/DUF423 family)